MHWHGIDTLLITVTDPLNVSGHQVIEVTVLPVPDAPGLFSLIRPENGFSAVDWPDTLDFFGRDSTRLSMIKGEKCHNN